LYEDFRPAPEILITLHGMIKKIVLVGAFIVLFRCDKNETGSKVLSLLQVFVGSTEVNISGPVTDGIPVDRSISLVFSSSLNQASAVASIEVRNGQQTIDTDITFLADMRTVVIFPAGTLESNTVYTILLSGELQGVDGETFTPLEISFKTAKADLAIVSAHIADTDIGALPRITNVPLNLSVTIDFSSPVDPVSLEDAVTVTGGDVPALSFNYFNSNKTATITTVAPLKHLHRYELRILETLEGALGESFAGYSKTFYTAAGTEPQLPHVSDEELLTIVQQQTFKYFRDFAHPESGMARERNTSGDVVTSGGSGFGIMSLIVGMERNFITRQQGLDQMLKIVAFLETADRFHGAWPHWMNGDNGDVIPFSADDNGGDLVETSFLIQGLLTFRQYLEPGIASEKSLADRITALWQSVEWNWYTRDGQDVLYWHWSPDKQWIMNHAIKGYNEALITYFLAAASPAHSIGASVYHLGWAGNGAIVNNKSFYDIVLPLGYDYGGPLFFAHYSFLGLDPRNLRDIYADYWKQNVSHSLINNAYCLANPKNFVGYSDENWGLTASDNHLGYSAHSPTNDLGVISPTAALSSFPYTPEQSMKALRFFYYTLGDRLWGPYGFYDAFNLTEGWTADSYLAIDQGPVIVMIENYRTGLLWDLFMSAPEVQVAMDKLGFTR
jgi:hypothetical protein